VDNLKTEAWHGFAAMGNNRNRYRVDRAAQIRVWVFRIKVVFAFGACVPLIMLLSAALAHSYYSLLDAPWLRVDEIQILGLKHLDRKEVLNALGVPRHACVLNLKLAELAKNTETLPWTRSTVVRLDLPGRLVVELAEREPVAIVYADDFYLLDAEGKLFIKATIEQYPKLLLVTGFSGMNLKQGAYLPPEPLEPFKRLIESLTKSQNWMPLNQISECRWHKDEGYILYTTQKAIPIELGWEYYEQKLDRLQRILAVLAERQVLDVVTRIDLDYPSRAYVSGKFPVPKGI
jgi:cell division protein FtsQ